ncbi:hypothetical protein KPL78_04275 [Roseomonas sp. HJA6]|uniref:Uncharacterized protein n=1 Tax=Roseomonas alba TaxID=2846776 RepID=A0ABS7A427_9PROT|nr:hypothetical protein [Neoroseomonas alba]MBW6397049.1 hypothetical protein [Neoroseomonas alba]
MKIPAPTREFHIAAPGTGPVPLWIARIEFAEDAALAERVVHLGVRDRHAGTDGPLVPLSTKEHEELEAGEQALRTFLLTRLRNGRLVARGIPAGSIETVALPTEAWADAIVDWWNSAIDIHGTEVRGILVGASGDARVAAPVKPDTSPSRRPRGRSFRALDAPFAELGARMVLEGKATGPMDAALALSDRLAGKKEGTTRAKRLAPLIRKCLADIERDAGQSGQTNRHSDHSD